MPGPTGGSWSPSAINGNASRGTGILNNEMYVGRLVWNRLRYLKNPTSGKRQSRANPKEEWVVTDVPELRIVSQELWTAVKTRQSAVTRDTRPEMKAAQSNKVKFWEQRRPRHLLSGLVKCGCCGLTTLNMARTGLFVPDHAIEGHVAIS